MRKKNLLVSLSVATLLMTSAVITTETGSNTNIVQAASKKKKLTHNAYVYKANGKRAHKKTLKKGKSVRVYSIKKIKGKKYYRIGKNQYVKLANFAKKINKKTTSGTNNTAISKPTNTVKTEGYYLTHRSYVYNSKGQRVKAKTIVRNTPVTVYGKKTIKGTEYLNIGNGRYIKATNAKSIINANNGSSDNNSVNEKPTSGSKVTKPIKPTTEIPNNGKRYNVSKTSMDNEATVSSQAESKARKGMNENVYFTDEEVNQIQARLWQDIQNYRVSKGYPAFKTNAELTKLAETSQIPQTKEFARFNNTVSQNTNDIKTFLPNLTQQGLDQANGYVNQSLYGLNSTGQLIGGDRTHKGLKPNEVADGIFNLLKESDGFEAKMLYGWKEYKAYGALSCRYYISSVNPKQNALGISFFTADGTSTDWVNAWNKN